MKRIFLILIFSGAVASAAAQQKWTLRQCIDYAVENNIDIRQTALSVESAEIELNTTQNSRLPNLNAGLGQSFGFGRTISDDDENTYMKNTQVSSTSITASTSIPVFQGFRINNQVKQDKLNLLAATENLDKAKENLALNITAYYLDVLFYKEILNVYREQVALTREQVAKTEILVSNGKVPESQLFDIRAELATNEVNVITAENNLVLSLLNLSQALNLEWSDSFDIATPYLDDEDIENPYSIQPPDYVYKMSVGMRPAVREAEYRLQSSEYQVKLAKSNFWPTISLGASFSDGYTYMFGQEYAQQNFGTQFRNKHSESVGLNVSIPIFNRFQTRNNVRTARLNVVNYSLQLENVKLALYKEIHQAYQGAVAAQAKHEATGRALDAAQEAFRAMEMRYEYGKATVYEYNETQTRLISNKSEQVQAKYEFLFRTKVLDFYMGEELDI